MPLLGRPAASRLSQRDTADLGQGLVEFALVLPLILLLISGIVEFGRMLAIYNGVSNASREAARYGAVVGDPGNGAGYYFLDCEGMRAAAKRTAGLATITDGDITIVYDHGAGAPFGTCTQGVQPNPPIANGDRVRVTVQASYAPILPLLPIASRTFTSLAAHSIFPKIDVAPACSDGIDNDGDGLIDYPADPGCDSSADNDEFNVAPCYILTLTIAPSGYGSVAANPAADPNCPSGQYSNSVTLTAAPTNANLHAFSSWSGDLTGSANPAVLPMNTNKAVTANFILRCYTLTLTAVNGSVTPSIVGAPPNGTCSGGYTYDTIVSLTATGNPGYAFSSWSGGLAGSANPAQIVINADKNVTANFVPVACYTLTAAVVSGSGSISANPPPNCSIQYNGGTAVTLTATADPGFQFSRWTDAGGATLSTANPVTVTMDAGKTYNANFTATPCYSLTLTWSSGGTASTSPAPNCGGNYYAGTAVTLTATPSTGFSFAGWTGITGGNPTTITMDGNKAISANFTANCYMLTTSVVPSPSSSPPASPAGGAIGVSVTDAPNGTCAGGYTYNTEIELTAAPAATYTFASWSGIVSGTANPVRFRMPASNTSAAARYNKDCVIAGTMTSAGKTISVNYTNYTGTLRNITQIVITWPNDLKLKMVAFGGSTLWSGNAEPPSITISSFGSGNTGLSDAAQKTLTATFSSNVGGTGAYTVKTTFNDGCAPVTVTGTP